MCQPRHSLDRSRLLRLIVPPSHPLGVHLSLATALLALFCSECCGLCAFFRREGLPKTRLVTFHTVVSSFSALHCLTPPFSVVPYNSANLSQAVVTSGDGRWAEVTLNVTQNITGMLFCSNWHVARIFSHISLMLSFAVSQFLVAPFAVCYFCSFLFAVSRFFEERFLGPKNLR